MNVAAREWGREKVNRGEKKGGKREWKDGNGKRVIRGCFFHWSFEIFFVAAAARGIGRTDATFGVFDGQKRYRTVVN